MVLEDGSILEFDAPNKLLEQGVHFYNMTRDTRLTKWPVVEPVLCDQQYGYEKKDKNRRFMP